MPHDDKYLNERMPSQAMVCIPITYRAEWDDGFGAQGWKLDAAIDDRQVVACMSYTGHKSPTSVLVHDILDHMVSGLSLSGYRNEAVATTLHGLRNGIEFKSSFEWMVDEIVAAAHLNESLSPFLTPALANLLTADAGPGLAQKNQLLDRVGKEALRKGLLAGFFRVGLAGIPHAIQQWADQGIDFSKMRTIGFALQALFKRADAYVSERRSQCARARCIISNGSCHMHIDIASVPGLHTLTEPVF